MFPTNMMDMLKQAQKMKADMQKLQDDLAQKTVESTAGAGMVKAVVNGKQRLVSLTIEPSLLQKGDVAMTQDLVVAAVNDALQASTEMMSAEMNKVMGGMGGALDFLKGRI